LRKWYENLSETERAALKDPNAILLVHGFASRSGNPDFNLRLSKRRALNTGQALFEEFDDVNATIACGWSGEDLADLAGRPDKRDNHEDRIVLININTASEGKGPEARRRLSELPNDYADKAKLEEGLHPRDRAFERDGRLFLPNVEDGSVRWIATKNVPQGYSELNNYWVFRKGDAIEAQHRYLEDRGAIENEWRRRTKAPLADLYGRSVHMDERLLERTRKVNRLLNRWTESYLEGGHSLETARQKTEERARHVLKMTIVPLVGLSI
jgi:hypothetical protein